MEDSTAQTERYFAPQFMCIYDVLESENDRDRRRFWVRPIFSAEMRFLQGASDNLISEMELVDNEKYVNYFRMTPKLFNQLLSLCEAGLTKQTVVRDPIPAKTRLQVVLLYLASGDSMTSISYAFRIRHNTVTKIIAEGCNEIWRCLKDSAFLTVNTNNWKSLANSFQEKWNFPNCIGAIDGKNVVLQAPVNSGSTFYNYKGTHSLVLLACSDAHYRFTLVDIGAEGRRSDGGIFRTSNIGQRFEEGSLQLPLPRSIGGNDGPILPFVLLGDEAFALTKYMMRPYPRSSALNRTKKIFNYRLSRGGRVIQSAFGIMAAKWRIYRRPIIASVPTAIKIVQATCCLHNYIISHEAVLPATQRFYSTVTTEERSAGCYALLDIDNTGSVS
ncbi:putative nuclease HARBI1 [Athalia rosae]|uniref:putative nuclease HARBI1 n=1 Tax=Athalia rosae TaxID=37344 RepID=UPI00203396D0|nr:putative nuclease HARBI1 [Athalia rosae]